MKPLFLIAGSLTFALLFTSALLFFSYPHHDSNPAPVPQGVFNVSNVIIPSVSPANHVRVSSNAAKTVSKTTMAVVVTVVSVLVMAGVAIGLYLLITHGVSHLNEQKFEPGNDVPVVPLDVDPEAGNQQEDPLETNAKWDVLLYSILFVGFFVPAFSILKFGNGCADRCKRSPPTPLETAVDLPGKAPAGVIKNSGGNKKTGLHTYSDLHDHPSPSPSPSPLPKSNDSTKGTHEDILKKEKRDPQAPPSPSPSPLPKPNEDQKQFSLAAFRKENPLSQPSIQVPSSHTPSTKPKRQKEGSTFRTMAQLLAENTTHSSQSTIQIQPSDKPTPSTSPTDKPKPSEPKKPEPKKTGVFSLATI